MNKISKFIQTSLLVISYFVTLHPIEYEYTNNTSMYEGLQRIKTKNKKNLKFIPIDKFGGHQARGTYNSKQQIAIILDGHTKYHFTQVVTSRTNDIVPDGKNINLKIQKIGFFSNKKNHAGMPVTTYIYGVLNTILPLPERSAMPLKQPLAPIGSNPATYAPITFKPSDQFKGDGLIGNYFAAAQIATIHDPTQQNLQSYTFNQVEKGGADQPEGLMLIGSYADRPQCQGNICSHAMILVNLYGILQNNE